MENLSGINVMIQSSMGCSLSLVFFDTNIERNLLKTEYSQEDSTDI